jgi:hypothetical protein
MCVLELEAPSGPLTDIKQAGCGSPAIQIDRVAGAQHYLESLTTLAAKGAIRAQRHLCQESAMARCPIGRARRCT